MSIKQIHVCDGCGKELTKTSQIYHLYLRTDKFWSGADSDFLEKHLEFCERCAGDIKHTLQKLVNRSQVRSNGGE